MKKRHILFLGRLPVKTKFILIMIFVAYTSIFMVSSMSYLSGRNIINERVEVELTITTQNILEQVNKHVYDRLNDMQLLVSDTVLSDPDVSAEEKTEILRKSLVNLGWYNNLYLTDENGVIHSSTNRISLGADISEEDWYISTRRDFVNVSEVVDLSFTSEDHLVISNTVLDRNNNLVGVIFGEFSLEVLNALLKNSADELDVFLLDEIGQVVASKNSTDESMEAAMTRIDAEITVDNDYLAKTVESDGYLGFSGNGWRLVVQTPKAVVYAPLSQFAFFLWITVIFISLLVIVVGQLAARRFMKPINALTAGVAEIEAGNFNQKIEVQTEDEFGYLAQSFNQMTDSIVEKTRNLMEEKGKYKSILESTDEAIVLFDTKNRVIAFNQQFKKLFSYSNANVANVFKVFAPIFDFEDRPEMRQVLQEYDFKKLLDLEVTVETPQYHILKLYSRPVKTESDHLLGRIWVFNDVTEERVAARNRDEFIRMASHKLRTPLTAINWTIQMFGDKEFGDISGEQLDAVKQISANADRLNSLIEVLLDVDGVKKYKTSITRSKFMLGPVVEEAYDEVIRQYTIKENVDFEIVNREEVMKLKVLADQVKIKELLIILLKNALLYSTDGRPNRVRIELKHDKSRNKLIVCTSDTGIGIPKEEEAQIFGKFFRGNVASLHNTEGIGLDLYLAKTIIDSSNEKIWFHSDEDEGTMFCFTLELAD